MGVSHRSCVVIGVRVSDVLQVKVRTKTETKYDPDSGKPFEKTTDEWVATLFGQDRVGLEPNPDEWEHSKYAKRPSVLPEGLKVFDTGNDARPDYADRKAGGNPYVGYYDYTKHVIGVQLNARPAGVFDDEPVWAAGFNDLALAFAQAQNMFREVGYHSLLKLFVVNSVSY